MPSTHLRSDRFGDTWTVHTGPAANAIRRTIKREQEAALSRYDADPSPENRAALLSHEGVEAEIGRRLAEQRRRREAA